MGLVSGTAPPRPWPGGAGDADTTEGPLKAVSMKKGGGREAVALVGCGGGAQVVARFRRMGWRGTIFTSGGVPSLGKIWQGAWLWLK